jgi:hypothetical protein
MGPHQFIFIVRLADEYFEYIAANRSFAVPIVEGCLSRLNEVGYPRNTLPVSPHHLGTIFSSS